MTGLTNLERAHVGSPGRAAAVPAAQTALTVLVGRAAAARGGAATTAVIRWFIRRYGVDMSEAADPDAAHYPTFNEFFTRALKPGARPLAAADLLCPVDGAISQFGAIAAATRSFRPRATATRPALRGGDAAAGRAISPMATSRRCT